jgi:poly(hydroxyalkanoate) granule-associated protein
MSSNEKSGETPAEQVTDAKAADATADWSEQVKKFAMAAIGAVNLSPDDVKVFTKRLVEKGELAKKDGERIIKQFADKVQATVKREGGKVAEKAEEAKQAVQAAGEKAGATFNQEKLAEKINVSIERMLHGMNIATRKDVEDLGKQLDDLDRKLGELVDAAGAGGRRKHAGAAS